MFIEMAQRAKNFPKGVAEQGRKLYFEELETAHSARNYRYLR